MTQNRGERPRYRVRVVGAFSETVEATVDGRNRWQTDPRNATRERALAILADMAMPDTTVAGLSLGMKPALAIVLQFPESEIIDVPESPNKTAADGPEQVVY